jgi:enamine deaminase RidA (YjgF/YER057c/UK114 family)
LEGVRSINGQVRGLALQALANRRRSAVRIGDTAPLCNAQNCRCCDASRRFDVGSFTRSVLKNRLFRRAGKQNLESAFMLVLQPAEWSKPRGFSHGVVVDGPGKWIVLAGQTGGNESGEYQTDMAGQVGTALKRIVKLLGEAGAGPEHIVRLTWYLTSKSEYEAAGAGIGAAWKETLGRNFPPSTLLYISGLVDARAKVEIEVTAFVPAK